MPRLQRVIEMFDSTMREPQLSQQLVRELPTVIRGRRYGNAWVSQRATDLNNLEAAVNPLAGFFNSHTNGRGVWKWTHYFDIYHRHLQKFIGQDVHILEVGVYSGGSLEMWRNYFGVKCHIYGIDIREECKALQNDSTRIFIGDQGNRDFWRQFRQEVPVLDVLIDDGGHLPEQQIVTLEEVLPHLRPGGVFVCEDVMGEFNRFGAYIGGLAANLDITSLREGPGKELRSTAASFQADINSIHRYPYVTVIEKRAGIVRQFTAPAHGTEWSWLTSSEKRAASKKP